MRLPAIHCLSLLAGLLLPSVAAASDKYFFTPASVCQPSNAGRNNTDYNQWGVSNVSSSAWLHVECPLLTRSSQEDFALLVQGIAVYVYDRHGSDDLSCTIRAVDLDLNTAWFDTQWSSGSGRGYQTLVFSPPRIGAHLTWSMSCSLPAAVGENRSAVTAVMMVAPF